jgi:hypothetical protein
MKTYTGKVTSEQLDPFHLAAANFSQLERTEKGVSICHECLLCVTNMDTNADALKIHCVFNPKCKFILRELSLQEIVFICETCDLKKLLNDHFYMYSTILHQNPTISKLLD